jgi:hypothetical protein
MGKKSPAPPPAPDYAGAARETAAANLEAIKYQTEANRINQKNPWGELTYTRDPNNPNQWTQTETLTPEAQAALDAQLRITQGRSNAAETMLGRAQDAYAQDFNPTRLNDYLSGVGAVDQSSVGRAGQFGSGASVNTDVSGATAGVQGLNQNYSRFSSNAPGQITGMFGFAPRGVQQTIQNAPLASQYTGGVQGVSQNAGENLGGVNPVNQNAPQFNVDPSTWQKAAFESSMSMLRPELEQREQRLTNQLQLQGLNAGSEAFNNATGQFNRDVGTQLNQLANQAVLTGTDVANRNYASQLAGFGAGNEAQGQAFGQGMSVFGANNQARTQALQNELARYSGDLSSMNFMNDSRNQAFSQQLAGYGANQSAIDAANRARATQFGQDTASFGLNQDATSAENAARTQALQNVLAQFQLGNEAQGQRFNQDLAGYQAGLQGLSTNAALQQAQNAAQNQAYGQALNNYGTNWQQEQTLRNLPLNELNALLTGQQVQNPTFEGFALQGNAGGADLLGAAQLQGQDATNRYNAQMANRSSTFGSLGSLFGAGLQAAGTAGSFAALFSDKRLKDNIEKVGETPGGTNVYTWDWNEKAEEVGADKQPNIGVIAQENPRAIWRGGLKDDDAKKGKKKGFLMVDYSKIK